MKLEERLLSEASEFLGIPVEELRRRFEEAEKKYTGFLKWIHVSEEEWLARGINQQDEKEVARFYQETGNYIPELVEAWTPDKYRLSQRAVNIIKENRGKRVADYGAGIGEASIMQALNGLEATAVDLPGKTFDFAKFRFKKRGLNIKTIDIIPGQLPLTEQYSAITCFEVMQHLFNPEQVLEHFHEHLAPGGLLLLTHRFKGNYALALKANERYDGIFSQVVESRGFKQKQRVHMWGPVDTGKYLEVYEK